MEENPQSQSCKEEDPKTQSLQEAFGKSLSLEEEDPKSQSLKEEDPKSQSLQEQEPESQNLEEEDPKSRSLEEEHPKSQSSEEGEGQDGIAVPGFNENSLQFLDSIDGYLTLLDSLSWTLRQGWLQLASARHSMGESRVSGAVLDLKSHSASTFVQVTEQSNPGVGQIHHFTLHKWASSDNDNGAALASVSPQIRQRKDKDGTPPQLIAKAEADHQNQLHKERSKSLLVFGGLVSPKLRAAQLSFESALDALVEIANMRSLMLSTLHKVREELEAAKAK